MWRAALGLLLAAATSAAQSVERRELAPVWADRFLQIDAAFTFDAPSFGVLPNGTAHAQDVVVSANGWQYAGYWNADRELALARRRLPDGAWETLAFPDYLIQGQDSHNSVSIGISRVDGRLHLAFDHHVDPLHYRVSSAGLIDDPTVHPWDPSSFGPVTDILDPARGPLVNVTYPRFVPSPDGGLHFVYREFTSGNGRLRWVDYDGATAGWTGDRVFIERTGTHDDPLGGPSNSRNAYLNRIAFDDFGIVHATWTWREAAAIPYNRDIAYAYSEDGGLTWLSNDGTLIADTTAGSAITADSAGVNVVALGAEWGLMNSQAQAVDGRGRVHVVMYHKDVPDTVVSFGNASNSHYNHYWREADGVWRSSRLDTIGNRPKAFADRFGRVLLAYRAAGGGVALDLATPEADYLDWRRVYWRGGAFGSSAQADEGWFASTGVLSLVFQDSPASPGATTRLGSLDLRPNRLAPPRRRGPDACLLPEADAFVRGGAYAEVNFGLDERLLVKESPSPDYDRWSYLRFDLSSLVGVGTLECAVLRAVSPVMGPLGATTPVAAHFVNDDSWGETALTWNNRPALGERLAVHLGRPAMSWDVTSSVAAALAGDAHWTVALTSEREGHPRIVHLWAREASDLERIPRLELTWSR